MDIGNEQLMEFISFCAVCGFDGANPELINSIKCQSLVYVASKINIISCAFTEQYLAMCGW